MPGKTHAPHFLPQSRLHIGRTTGRNRDHWNLGCVTLTSRASGARVVPTSQVFEQPQTNGDSYSSVRGCAQDAAFKPARSAACHLVCPNSSTDGTDCTL